MLSLLAAAFESPELLATFRAEWADYRRRFLHDGLPEARAMLVQLALDGLYFSELLGLEPPTGKLRDDLRQTLLALAILSEVAGSTSLKLSQGFSKLVPSVFVVLGFGAAFFFLAQALRGIPLSIAYAVWAGVGTALTVLVGVVVFKESFDVTKALGLVAILGVVLLLNLKGAH